MKVLLINPPCHRLKGFGHIYHPLGLGYLCAIAEKLGIEAKIYNAEAPDFNEKLCNFESHTDKLRSQKKYIDALNDNNHYVWKEAREVIDTFRPDIIGITVMTVKYPSAKRISEMAKTLDRHIKVVWGGPHPTICTKEVINEPTVDFVVFGEGEQTFEELLLAILAKNCFDKIKGLAYKENGVVKINPSRELIKDLDRLPLTDRVNVLYPERYTSNSFGHLITTRGCPFSCGYCSAKNIWSRACRYRTVENVVTEIRWVIEKYNTKNFYFWDSSFTVSRKHAMAICKRLIDDSLDINWGCETRVDTVDLEMLKMMKKAGCQMIRLGVESGSERILNNIQKNITIEQAKKAVRMIKNCKIPFEIFIMIGFPDETQEDIDKTFHLMKEIKGGAVCFSIFVPYPGTALFDVAQMHGLIPERINWGDIYPQNEENCFVKGMTKEQFRKNVYKFSHLVDSKNAENLKIGTLILKTLKEFHDLIKTPFLIFHKCNTFMKILKRKIFM